MKKEIENLVVFIFVSVVSIAVLAMLFTNGSLTGAHSGEICGPVYSEVSGTYYVTCYYNPDVKTGRFEEKGRLDYFTSNPDEPLQQFPTELWVKRNNPPEKAVVYYRGTPYSINYKDSNIGVFDREKWLQRHGLNK